MRPSASYSPTARYPRALADAILPPRTPSGRPIPREGPETDSPAEILAQVAAGQFVRPSVAGVSRWHGRDDITLLPIADLPPLPLGLIWVASRENARIRALAETAQATNTGGEGYARGGGIH